MHGFQGDYLNNKSFFKAYDISLWTTAMIDFVPSKKFPSFSMLAATELWRSSPIQTGQMQIQTMRELQLPTMIVDNLS